MREVIDVAGLALPVIGEPNDDEIDAARRAVALHRRRSHTSRCTRCGFRWRVSRTRSGRCSVGCLRRRQAIELLDHAGLLDRKEVGEDG